MNIAITSDDSSPSRVCLYILLKNTQKSKAKKIENNIEMCAYRKLQTKNKRRREIERERGRERWREKLEMSARERENAIER